MATGQNSGILNNFKVEANGMPAQLGIGEVGSGLVVKYVSWCDVNIAGGVGGGKNSQKTLFGIEASAIHKSNNYS